MNLSKEELDKALRGLSLKFGTMKCPMCGSSTGFEFAPVEIQSLGIERDDLGRFKFDGRIAYIPTIAGTCKECGYIVQFNLRRFSWYNR